jgi:NADH dehydrogenase [ubiquinone] 1 alpha subcomplex assembly factor 7
MTALRNILLRRIRATGPMTLADYMAECLLHPLHGYYTTRDPLGAAGDFTTAPEISQMFGELLGLCLAQAWLDQGAPTPFTLAELGPGRGTLMADVLRVTRKIAGFHDGLRLILLEASPSLRSAQQRTLKGFGLSWLDEVADLPDIPLFLIANEFFDALPIRQFTRDADGWAETMVESEGDRLVFGRGMPVPLGFLAHRLADTGPGDVVEFCPAAGPTARRIAATIAARGGAAIIVDYGAWGSKGDTFQALRGHACADPLADPGSADLTAHVDFAALALAATGVTTGYATQGAFLTALGINARGAQLTALLQGQALQSHLAALHRLTSPEEMGQLFKVLALTPMGHPPLPGID